MSGVYRKERGESRAIYTAVVHDPDFLALSRTAKLLFYTLKMELGASGIDVMYPGQLADLTGIEYPEIQPTLDELEQGEWIRRDQNVVWLRNGLRYDPYLSTTNRRHVQAIVGHLSGLPRVGLVEEFCSYYGLDPSWIEGGVPDQLPTPAESALPSEPAPDKDVDTHSDSLPDRVSDREPDTGSRRKEVGGKPTTPATIARARLESWIGDRGPEVVQRFAEVDASCERAIPSLVADFVDGSMVGERVWGALQEGDRPPVLAAALEAYATKRSDWHSISFRRFVETEVKAHGNGTHRGADPGPTRPEARRSGLAAGQGQHHVE